MMRGLLLFFFFCATNLYSFTFISAKPSKFSQDEITVNVANDICTAADLTPESLLDLVEEALDSYWNKVPTTRLRFKRGSVRGISASSYTTTSAFRSAHSEANTIIVGCTAAVTDFINGEAIGQGGMTTINGVGAGALLIYNSVSFKNMSKRAKMSLIAHEVGHAFGLSHSNFEPALMYYLMIGEQKNLSRDDHDGITALYPNKKELGGLAGSCGTVTLIDNDSDNGGPGGDGAPLSILLGLFLTLFLHKNYKLNRVS